jgi:hypothetical protein
VDNWRVAARAGIGFFFGIERDSALPCHLWCIQTSETYGVLQEQDK